MTDTFTYLSLGAGVQSSTLALMAACGEITPMLDGAIFADTQAEPAKVYEWLAWLEQQLPFPVYRKTVGSLEHDSKKVLTSKRSGQRYAKNLIPAYVAAPDGTKGILARKCTADYKVRLITRTLRHLARIKRGERNVRVTQWIGISADEAHRMKPSGEPWIRHVWPLVDLGMTRADCLKWMEGHGYPRPPRSACVFCPFHSDAEWLRLLSEEPEEFNRAVTFEKDIQRANEENTGTARLNGVPYLHASLKPLEEVAFGELPDHYQLELGFGNDCEGLCGV